MVFTESFKVTRKTYSQDWKAYNVAQQHEKAELQSLLYELCRAITEPEQYRGRPRLSLADIIFSSAFKIYSTLSARRFMTDLREAKERGYISKLPAYNSLFRYLEAEALTPHLYQLVTISSLPLKTVETDFAVDPQDSARAFNAVARRQVRQARRPSNVAENAPNLRSQTQHRDLGRNE
jgi:hypothetical protein